MSNEDAVKLLREQLGKGKSQNKVGQEIGYSGAAVSLLLSGKYSGDINAICEAVLSTYSMDTVECPGLGHSITIRECARWCKQPFAATNQQRVHMYRTCRKCEKRRG